VVFVMSVTALLLGTGLVIDGGFAFVHRRDGQNAADMGALAGTQQIARYHIEGGVSSSDVWDAIDASVRANGCTPSGNTPCTWEARYIKPDPNGGDMVMGSVSTSSAIPSDAQGVEVTIASHPPTYFLPVIGQRDWDVGAEAAALTAQLEKLPEGQVVPIGVDPVIPPDAFISGATYQISVGRDAPGNFSWLSWDGSNSSGELAEAICDPNNPEMTFPVWLTGDPGATNSHDVRDCLDYWIAKGSTLLLPLWREVRYTGNNTEFEIIGLAAFVLKGYEANPAIDTLYGYFQEVYPLPTIGANYSGPPCNPSIETCGSQTTFLGLIR
jgi:hypothetical protein